MANLIEGKLELLADKNSVLVLVDYQPSMFKGVCSGDKTLINNTAIGPAKAASILGRLMALGRWCLRARSEIITACDIPSHYRALSPDRYHY